MKNVNGTSLAQAFGALSVIGMLSACGTNEPMAVHTAAVKTTGNAPTQPRAAGNDPKQLRAVEDAQLIQLLRSQTLVPSAELEPHQAAVMGI